MITSFEVGAIFDIDANPAMGSLTALQEKMQGLLATTGEVKGEFASLGRMNPFGRAARGADNLRDAMGRAAKGATDYTAAASAAGAATESAATSAVTSINTIAAAWDRASLQEQAYRDKASRPYAAVPSIGGGRGLMDDDEFVSAPRPRRIGGQRQIGSEPLDAEFEEVFQQRLLAGAGGGGGLVSSSGSYSGSSGPYRSGRSNLANVGGAGIGGSGGIGAPPGGGIPLNFQAPRPSGGPSAGVAMLEGFSVFEALKIAAQEDQSLRLGELALQLPTEGPLEAGYKEKLRDIARRASDGTIYSEGLTAAAIPVLAGPAGFHGDEGLEQFGSLFPIAIRSAEVAQQRHLGGLDDTLKANVGYAHMLGTYSGQPAIDSLNQLQAIGASVGKTPAEEENILGYSVPIGKALGGNVEDIADVTGFIQRQGLNSTTAGTGLAALMLQLTHAETLDAHDTHARARRRSAESEFASAMHLTPQAVHQLRSTNRESKKVEALEDIGLLDHQGHLADRLSTQGNRLNGGQADCRRSCSR